MKKIHGILIRAGTIQEVELEDKLEAFYEALGCDYIAIVERNIAGNLYSIVCDDEGLYNDDSPITIMDAQSKTPMIVGNVFICKYGEDEGLASLTPQDVQTISRAWKYKVLWARYK